MCIRNKILPNGFKHEQQCIETFKWNILLLSSLKNSGKYDIHENLRLPVFDGLLRLGMSSKVFHYFNICQTVFMLHICFRTIFPDLMLGNSRNFAVCWTFTKIAVDQIFYISLNRCYSAMFLSVSLVVISYHMCAENAQMLTCKMPLCKIMMIHFKLRLLKWRRYLSMLFFAMTVMTVSQLILGNCNKFYAYGFS